MNNQYEAYKGLTAYQERFLQQYPGVTNAVNAALLSETYSEGQGRVAENITSSAASEAGIDAHDAFSRSLLLALVMQLVNVNIRSQEKTILLADKKGEEVVIFDAHTPLAA